MHPPATVALQTWRMRSWTTSSSQVGRLMLPAGYRAGLLRGGGTPGMQSTMTTRLSAQPRLHVPGTALPPGPLLLPRTVQASPGRTITRASFMRGLRSPRPPTRAQRLTSTWASRQAEAGFDCPPSTWICSTVFLLSSRQRYRRPTSFMLCVQLMYHVLGTPQSEDVTILADPEHP